MKRREFIKLLSGAAATLTGTWQAIWPIAARAQYQAPPPIQAPPDQGPATAPADNSVGQVATLQGSATVTRGNAATPLKIADPIYEKDTLQTALDSSLGITFDDETTFSLSANTRIVVDEFVYQEGGNANAASFNVAAGTMPSATAAADPLDDPPGAVSYTHLDVYKRQARCAHETATARPRSRR